MAQSNTDDNKNPVGRPLKYQTVEELEAAIKAYFDDCDPHWTYDWDWVKKRTAKGELIKDKHGQDAWVRLKVRKVTEQKPYTISGLAVALGISRQTLLNYKERPEFLDSIEAAKDRCESYWEGLLASPFANGAKFNLNNNYSTQNAPWTDKQVLAGDPDAPLGLFGDDALTVKVINAGADTQPEAADDVPNP